MIYQYRLTAHMGAVRKLRKNETGAGARLYGENDLIYCDPLYYFVNWVDVLLAA